MNNILEHCYVWGEDMVANLTFMAYKLFDLWLLYLTQLPFFIKCGHEYYLISFLAVTMSRQMSFPCLFWGMRGGLVFRRFILLPGLHWLPYYITSVYCTHLIEPEKIIFALLILFIYYLDKQMLLLLLSRFSRVRLCATP